MARYLGKTYSKHQMMELVGDMSQITGASPARFDGGKGHGVMVVPVKTGTGLNFTVVPDRGMDIAWADYQGAALGFISKTGMVDSRFYEHDYDGFHRSFFAGLLTTCGLRNIGTPCMQEGEYLGLHGRINNIPAEDVCVENRWEGDEYFSVIKGKVRESKLYGENLCLNRTITSKLGEMSFTIEDEVENCGFTPQPLTILYHFNFGFPLLSENSQMILPSHTTMSRDKATEKDIPKCSEFEAPQVTFPETVFYHTLKGGKDNWTYAGIFNPDLGAKGVGCIISFDKTNLPCLVQWKNMAKGDYVVALEPSNAYPEGQNQIQEKGMLKTIQPGEVKKFSLRFQVVQGEDEIKDFHTTIFEEA